MWLRGAVGVPLPQSNGSVVLSRLLWLSPHLPVYSRSHTEYVPTLFWIAAAVGAALDGNPPAEVVPLRSAGS